MYLDPSVFIKILKRVLMLVRYVFGLLVNPGYLILLKPTVKRTRYFPVF